jgi:hypothetical protein
MKSKQIRLTTNSNMKSTTIQSMSKRLLFVMMFGMLAQVSVLAQPGSIETLEIEIVKPRQIDLPKASRNFEKIPPRPSEPISPPIQYDFRPFTFQTAQITPAIRPLKLKDQSPSDLYGGHVSAGYGNYASPYFEGFINTKRDKNKLVGAHAYFNGSGKGPVDGKNSASSNSGMSIYGKTFNQYVSLSGDISFDNRSTHFYGYPSGLDVNAKDIRQSYNNFKLGAALTNSRNTAFTYELGGVFNYLADRYDAKETEIDLNFNSGYKLSEESSIAIAADYAAITRKDALVEAKPRSLFTVNPSFVFYPVEDLRLSAGIVAAFENDSIDSKNVHAYPDLRASYPLSPSVDVVASLSGGMEKVSLQSLSRENIWIAPNLGIFHTNKLLDLQAALHTRIGNKVSVNGGFSLASLKNWYFFVNDTTDQSKFETVYDKGTVQRTNLFASIGFSQNESVKFLLRGDLYGYNTDEQSEAWHRPTYKVTGDVSFNIVKKVLLDFNLIAQGGMKARTFDALKNEQVIELDPALDLNARIEYLVSDKFSVFAQFNNITSSNYPVFLNYPVRGFQVLGGLTWSF